MNTMGGGPRNRNASVGDEFIPHSPCGMSIKGDPSTMSRVPPCKISPEQHGRKQAVPPASPTTSPHPLTLRRMLSRGKSSSAATTLARDVSSYAGPQPIGRDGLPLRSCLKHACTPPTSASSDSSVMGGGSGGRCCHKVSFSHVQLREYCRQVGDNPSVTCGAPLAIGWKFNKRGKIDIDTYEADLDKDPKPCERLSPQEREKILTEIGRASHSQIMQGQIQAYFDRQLRAETLDQIGGLKNCKSIGPRERLFIMRESAARKLDRAKRGFLGGSCGTTPAKKRDESP
ncbi:hypothetical protein ACHAXT_004037 [Thalassiosira profunda]